MKSTRQKTTKAKKTQPPQPTLPQDAMQLSHVFLDETKPAESRAKMLLDVVFTNHDPQMVLTNLLRDVAARTPENQVVQLQESYNQILSELEQGPVRPATFIREAKEVLPSPTPRVLIVTPDGQQRYPTLHPRVKLKQLRAGQTVYLDHRGSIVLAETDTLPSAGQEGTFIRYLPDSNLVEVILQNDQLLLHAAEPVIEAAQARDITKGDKLLVCPRRQFAFKVIPTSRDYRYRFVDDSKVPEILPERDIGSPHWVLEYMLRRLRILLFHPDMLKKFDLRPRFSVMLTGPSGCGKTLTIRAVLHAFTQMLVERTGRKDIGSRVIRVKVSELLSEWLGQSDKNIDDLFTDIQHIAAAPIETADGEELLLPVVVVLEEVEGIARRRGARDAAIYDRLLTTLLQRLDDTIEDLGQLPLLLISTSNRPDLIDSAMRRRLGIEARYSQLDRDGFTSVLEKKLKADYPYVSKHSKDPVKARKSIIKAVVSWLFDSAEENKGVVEVLFRDGHKLVKHRSDLLTGSVVEQAISTAIDRTVCSAMDEEHTQFGLTANAIIDALRQHLDSLADSLSIDNAADYLDLPENTQIAEVRRLRQNKGKLSPLLKDLDL